MLTSNREEMTDPIKPANGFCPLLIRLHTEHAYYSHIGDVIKHILIISLLTSSIFNIISISSTYHKSLISEIHIIQIEFGWSDLVGCLVLEIEW